MGNIIDVRTLSFSASGNEILRDVSLRVKENQFIGLIGPNGSGKTTLLKHIYRALPAGKNVIFLNGRDLASLTFRETAKQVTVMRQENGSDFDYTIMEMVLMGRSPYRRYYERDTAYDRKIAENALRFVGMEGMKERSFSTLSGGEKQRVLIARSLAQEADILLMDEPTNHLDVHYQWLLMEIIAGLGKTVLSVFHELNLACRFCDYLYVLKEGEICAQGVPAEVVTAQMLADIFCVQADIIKTEEGAPYIIFRSSTDAV